MLWQTLSVLRATSFPLLCHPTVPIGITVKRCGEGRVARFEFARRCFRLCYHHSAVLLRLLCLLCAVAACASAQVPVKGYYRKDGTYVQPHTRSGTSASKPASTGKSSSNGSGSTNSSATTTASDSGTNSTSYYPSANSTPDTAPAPTPQPVVGITPGMTKSEVVARAGNPNIQSSRVWVYTNRAKVTFTDDKVSAFESLIDNPPSGSVVSTTAYSSTGGATTSATTSTTNSARAGEAKTTTTSTARNSVATFEIQKRDVSTAEKREIYAEAGISKSEQKNYVIDHKVPLELGGSNDKSNLQPQPKAEAKVKDQWENYLAKEVKTGKMPLAEAQAEIQKSHAAPPPKH